MVLNIHDLFYYVYYVISWWISIGISASGMIVGQTLWPLAANNSLISIPLDYFWLKRSHQIVDYKKLKTTEL